MSQKQLWIAVFLASVVAAFGCRSALTEPPPAAEIGGVGGPRKTGAGDANAMVARAGAEFGKRPNRAAVERARTLYLEAVKTADAPVEAFLGAARATAWLVENEEDGQRREELAVEGVQIGQHCVRLFQSVPECTYRLALAVGQQARELPSTAADGLDVMVELLSDVIAVAPQLDFGGGDRVMALVLLRAPGWPAGPGDPETALIHAENATASFPDYPPNLLVLAEAFLANNRREEARSSYEAASNRAAERREIGEPEAAAWLADAEAGLAEIR